MTPDAPRHDVAAAIAQALLDEGAGPGNSIHGWRCEYPDMYGPCNCVTEVAAVVADAILGKRRMTRGDFVEELAPLIAQHWGAIDYDREDAYCSCGQRFPVGYDWALHLAEQIAPLIAEHIATLIDQHGMLDAPAYDRIWLAAADIARTAFDGSAE